MKSVGAFALADGDQRRHVERQKIARRKISHGAAWLALVGVCKGTWPNGCWHDKGRSAGVRQAQGSAVHGLGAWWRGSG